MSPFAAKQLKHALKESRALRRHLYRASRAPSLCEPRRLEFELAHAKAVKLERELAGLCAEAQACPEGCSCPHCRMFARGAA